MAPYFVAPFLHVREEMCYDELICSWVCLLPGNLLVCPCNPSTEPGARLIKAPDTHLLKERMNE